MRAITLTAALAACLLVVTNGIAHAQAGGLVGSIVGGAFGKVIGKGTFNGAVTDAQLTEIATKINKNLPTQVDSHTRLDKVEAGPGLALTYLHTLTGYKRDEIQLASFYGSFAPQLKKNVCGNAGLKEALSKQVRIAYNYKASDGLPVGTVRIGIEDCV